MAITAIPTTYKGIEFRSRLEAKWACVFDELGWQWDYEAVDLDGYIPDFILKFPHGNMLCEVKPATTKDELLEATEKVEHSGWDSHALVVGSLLHYGEWPDPMIGIVTAINEYRNCYWGWDWAVSHGCTACRRTSIHHLNARWHCRVCGGYDGDGHLGGKNLLPEAWKTATNTVKYRHGKR
jgi:hypothetical protein